MTLKKRFYIAVTVSLILATLRFIYRDAQNEWPVVLNLMLGGIMLYMLLFVLFQTGRLKVYKVNSPYKIIASGCVISVMILGINMANEIDETHESFWVINGNKWLTDLLAVFLLLFVFYLVFSWAFDQWQRTQILKNEKSKAELALLKSQVNPHFFFNTLNNLYAMIKKDSDAAQEYVLKLSDMMRFTIYSGKKDSVSLEEELNYLTNFIELQTARYHTKVDIVFNQEVDNAKRHLPPLLFIFLVENAFKHGVEKLISGAFIHIDFVADASGMSFTIKNNFEPDNSSAPHGIGLQNLKERLNLLYPNKHTLTTNSDKSTYVAKLELTTA